LLGVININDKKEGLPFTEEEFNLLKVIADQAAVALENAFLVSQLRTKANELEDINRKLIETDMDKTEFITRISHELRSPLNSIKGAIHYLQQSEKLKKGKEKEFLCRSRKFLLGFKKRQLLAKTVIFTITLALILKQFQGQS